MKHRQAGSARHPRQAQRGVTLVVALIMLTALGLLAAWAVKMGTTNLRVVGNSQARQDAFTTAQAAIERTISTAEFSQRPDAVAAQPIAIDLDGNGSADLSATLSPAPACYRVRPVKVTELDPAQASDRPCLRSSASATAGIEFAGSSGSGGDSLCADTEWNVRAVVTDTTTGASVAVNQGMALRTLVTDANNACP